MTRKKKQLYGAVLVVGALAMLLDRSMFVAESAPQTAVAATTRSLSDLGVDQAAVPSVSVAATPFPAVRSDGSSPDGLRDLFSPTATVREAMYGVRGAKKVNPAGEPTPEAFAEAHHLRAVMIGGQVSFAIVDEKWLRVGDRLDDCELIEVTGTSAVFRCASDPVTLSIIGTTPPADSEKSTPGS